MSKMKQLLEIRDDFENVLNNLNSLLAEEENPDQMSLLDDYAIPDEEPNPKPVSFDALQKHCAEKSRAGHADQLREIILSYKVDKLSAIDPRDYLEVWEKVSKID